MSPNDDDFVRRLLALNLGSDIEAIDSPNFERLPRRLEAISFEFLFDIVGCFAERIIVLQIPFADRRRQMFDVAFEQRLEIGLLRMCGRNAGNAKQQRQC